MENILKKFGDKYHERDQSNMFVNGNEAQDFAFLIITLQTVQHNVAIKEKYSLERFQKDAKTIIPDSYDSLPKDLVEKIFHKVTG